MASSNVKGWISSITTTIYRKHLILRVFHPNTFDLKNTKEIKNSRDKLGLSWAKLKLKVEIEVEDVG